MLGGGGWREGSWGRETSDQVTLPIFSSAGDPGVPGSLSSFATRCGIPPGGERVICNNFFKKSKLGDAYSVSNLRAPRASETCHFVFSLASCAPGARRGRGRGLVRAGVSGSELATPEKAVTAASGGGVLSTCLSPGPGAKPRAKDINKEINK